MQQVQIEYQLLSSAHSKCRNNNFSATGYCIIHYLGQLWHYIFLAFMKPVAIGTLEYNVLSWIGRLWIFKNRLVVPSQVSSIENPYCLVSILDGEVYQ